MKKIIYILSLFVFMLSSCQNEDALTDNSASGKIKEMTFTFDVPDFHVCSRAIVDESISKIALLEFDKDNQYIEHTFATDINSSGFNASISARAVTIHFLANYDGIDNLNDRIYIGKSAETVVPSFEVSDNHLVFWGKIDNIGSSQSFDFIRNQAKVTINNGDNAFTINGFALCHYASTGVVCPFDASTCSFTYNDSKSTIGSNPAFRDDTNADNMDAKYMCEYDNTENDCYVIIKATPSNSQSAKYYKILIMDNDKNPYTIVRNVNYIININKLLESYGSSSFEAAKTAASVNNVYAEVIKDSPTIKDGDNSLTVAPLTHIVCQKSTIESSVTTTGNGEVTLGRITDPDNILSNVAYKNNKVSADVATVTKQCKATIEIRYGILSRVITVIASPQYTFSYKVDKSEYTSADQAITLTITIDRDYPSHEDYPELYPIKCYITTENLYPIDDIGKSMLIEYINGKYRYQYLATETGDHLFNFKTKLGSVNDTVTVEIDGFETSTESILLTGKTNN